MITVGPDTLYKVLDLCYSCEGNGSIKRIVPMIWGYQGIGKSQIVSGFTKDYDLDFRVIHIGTMDSPADLLGMPEIDRHGRTTFTKPDWFPEPGTKGVIFFDELNRGNNLLQQAMFPVLLDGVVGTHEIPEGWMRVAAGNPPSDTSFIVNELDAALLDRVMHIYFSPTKDEWISWAVENDLPPQILSFVSDYDLDRKKLSPVEISATPRSLEMLGILYPHIGDNKVLRAVCEGLLGSVSGSSFVTYQKSLDNLIKAVDILNNYDAVRPQVLVHASSKFTNLASLKCIITQLRPLMKRLTKSQLDNLESFRQDLPDDMKALINA